MEIHYLLVYKLTNPNNNGGNYQRQIITFLFEKGGTEVMSAIGDTIVFKSTEPISFWNHELTSLRRDIYYILAHVCTDEFNQPKIGIFSSATYRVIADSEIEEIQNGFNGLNPSIK